MPITKRPCANCPFRCDGAGVELSPGRLEGIVSDLLADDQQTFVCHKTLDKERMPGVIRMKLLTPESCAHANDLLMNRASGWSLVQHQK